MRRTTTYPSLELGDDALASEQSGGLSLLDLHLQLLDLLLQRLAERVDLHRVLLLLVQLFNRSRRVSLHVTYTNDNWLQLIY